MAKPTVDPEGWILPAHPTVWTCEDCGREETSTDPIPLLPGEYELIYLCAECDRAWRR